MNSFLSVINAHKDIDIESSLRRAGLEILQVNVGDLCNQSCSHCHIDASPRGKNIMSRGVIDDIIQSLLRNRGLVLDITGGAPELNPHFDYFIVKVRPFVREIIVRSNLTVFFEPGKEYLFDFFKQNFIHLICSLPCYSQRNVDAQRGRGVFHKSIQALKKLNEIGYAQEDDLALDLVYNPNGAYLPPQQEILEKEYKHNLRRDYGVEFNNLITITNVPIKRFKNYLETNGQYHTYLNTLKNNFNPHIVQNIMCRIFLSVGYDGKLSDCDFNQALGWVLKDERGKPVTIDRLDAKSLEGREIMVGEHCLSCTAGYGSSCQGALADKEKFVATSVCSGDEGKKELVKQYYSTVLKSKKDLKTNACCSVDAMPPYQRKILARIDEEILDKFYGCGSSIPPFIEGCTVLDLGCGTGKDVYITSYLVGEGGRVIGVDMTDEQLEIAQRYISSQMKQFGFKYSNVEFKKGYIENLKEIDIKDKSIDVVISNCVINLSPDKRSVFQEIFRVLKPGGELYFSDVFSGRKMPQHIKDDPTLYGECLGGALYIEDFRRILRDVGCPDYRVVTKRKLVINNRELQEKVGMVDFYSMTIRAFKLHNLEDICEDYGQVATYLGTIQESPHRFLLDDHHIFIANKPMLVCGNTASMLKETRFGKHFEVSNDRSVHFGPFACRPAYERTKNDDSLGGSCC